MTTRFLAALEAQANPDRAPEMARYHKSERRFLGLSNPQIDNLVKEWRKELSVEERVDAADALWRSDIHEARVAAAKLLTQARIRPDEAVWALLQSWTPDFDGWALADHACIAGQKRLVAQPARLDDVEKWTRSPHMWTRRAALVITLPWTKQRDVKPDDRAIRERVLIWAAGYVPDREWFIQKAIAWWLRDLSKRDPDRVRRFLAEHGSEMKAFARKEASRHLAY